jgi:hypothetical protein
VRDTSNILVGRIVDTSNYVRDTSNILVNKANINAIYTCNYIVLTSNIISERITKLTTDEINENPDAKKKYIIEDKYNGDLTINGALTLNSNLLIHDINIRLETFTAENLEVINAITCIPS